MKIYVGNLSFETNEENLRKAFEGFGEVTTVNIVTDKFTGESRGFGFIEMSNKDEAMAAISGMNGKDMNGRTLKVNEARPREERDNRGGRGGYGGGGDRRRY